MQFGLRFAVFIRFEYISSRNICYLYIGQKKMKWTTKKLLLLAIIINSVQLSIQILQLNIFPPKQYLISKNLARKYSLNPYVWCVCVCLSFLYRKWLLTFELFKNFVFFWVITKNKMTTKPRLAQRVWTLTRRLVVFSSFFFFTKLSFDMCLWGLMPYDLGLA